MITVGLDFGTHQTKLCIENKNGAERSYKFMQFQDSDGNIQYTLPSIINVGADGKLKYGYLPENISGTIVRYFKQSAFCTISSGTISQRDAMLYSIWYIAYILFDLEEEYGQDFVIQMGAPTDSSHLESVKRIATQILSTAYKIVEDLFANNKQEFLDTTIDELRHVTEIEPYLNETKEAYGILVFPEAYACLMPLVSQQKISTGMSLMVDIGGGTTDISFFTIKESKPKVYDFISINKGLNFLTGRNDGQILNRRDSNVKHESEIRSELLAMYKQEIRQYTERLYKTLQQSFQSYTKHRVERLFDALKNRPIIFCGGGSTFGKLRVPYNDFCEIHHVSREAWDAKSILRMDEIHKKGLVPILSTAYGLSISVANDIIELDPLKELFRHMKGYEEDMKGKQPGVDGRSSFGSAFGGFNYGDDYDAWK